MRWMRGALVFVSLAGVLFLPAEALAITLAPPGKSGADQYFETIPNSAGNAAPPSGGGTNGSGSALSHLGSGRAGSAKLSRLGKDGRSAAALAAATAPSTTAPTGAAPSGAGPSAGSQRHGQGAPASPGDSPITSLGNALSGADSGGLGIVLPLLLGTSLVLGLALIISRARHRSEPPELSA